MNETMVTYSDQDDDLEQLLSDLEGGYRVTFLRKEPPWAEENLGTVDFSGEDTISPDWIRNRFGGGIFAIKIKEPNGKYITHRTITIKERPKNRQGLEIWPGADGVPITKIDMDKSEPKQQAQNANDPMVAAMQTMMDSQAKQSEMMQKMLIGRVSSLENSLTQKINEPVATGVPVNYDPNQQLKTTLETMAMIEKLKENVTQNQPERDDDDEIPYFGAILEKLIEKVTEPKPQQGNPQLQGAPQLDNVQLAQLVKQRMAGMPQNERQALIQQVAGDDIEWEEEDEELETGHNNTVELNSMLTDEDKEQLDESGGGSNNDGQAGERRIDSPST